MTQSFLALDVLMDSLNNRCFKDKRGVLLKVESVSFLSFLSLSINKATEKVRSESPPTKSNRKRKLDDRYAEVEAEMIFQVGWVKIGNTNLPQHVPSIYLLCMLVLFPFSVLTFLLVCQFLFNKY